MKTMLLALVAASLLTACGVGPTSAPTASSQNRATASKTMSDSQIKAAIGQEVVLRFRKQGLSVSVNNVLLGNVAYAQGGAMAFIADVTIVTATGAQKVVSAFGRYSSDAGLDIDYIDDGTGALL